MSNGISMGSAIVETYCDRDGNSAIARIDSTLFGSAMQICLVDCGKSGVFWLARRTDDERNDYILMLPGERWEQDARDAGFTLIQKLNQRTP